LKANDLQFFSLFAEFSLRAYL